MSKSETSVTVGPGFFTLLGLLFIGLKLAEIIDWSWWLVLLPLYGPPLLLLTVIGGVLMLGLFIGFLSALLDR